MQKNKRKGSEFRLLPHRLTRWCTRSSCCGWAAWRALWTLTGSRWSLSPPKEACWPSQKQERAHPGTRDKSSSRCGVQLIKANEHTRWLGLFVIMNVFLEVQQGLGVGTRSWLSSSVPAGATWSPTSFIVDDGQDPDGLNLGSVVVDEEKALIILIYSIHFHTSGVAGTMMVASQTDGLSWSRPRNISSQIGVQPFAPGPGFGIQVGSTLALPFWVNIKYLAVCAPASEISVYSLSCWDDIQLFPLRSSCVDVFCRSATAQLKGGWWCVATARRRATEFSASWATTTDRRGSAAARWGASPSTVPRELRTSTPTSPRYPRTPELRAGELMYQHHSLFWGM